MPDPSVPPPLSAESERLVDAYADAWCDYAESYKVGTVDLSGPCAAGEAGDALRLHIATLEARPCPHVITSGTTSHCGLAASDAAADLAQIRRLSALLREAGDVLNDNAHWDNRAGGLVERIQSAVGGGL